jgi:two-component system response regulator AtoC
MHSSAPFHPQPSGLSLVEFDPGVDAVQVVGVSAAWRKLLVQADMVAPQVQVATIEGEHGTGKHTLARYLFSRSPLSTSNFQRRDAREWLATDADASTLSGFTYLDRVDLLAPPGQGLLLGVLRNLQDRPPGHAVLIASSQTPLRLMAGQGLLLPDLAFRLTSIRFFIPPLRQRREDIAPLVQFLLDRICARYQQRPVLLGPGALARLLQHSWPGNVREMAAILENALLQAENGVIRASDLALPEGLPQIPNSQFDPQLTSNSVSSSAFNSLSTAPANPHINPQLNPQLNPWSNPSTGNGQMLDPQSSAGAADLALDTIINHHVQFVLDFNRGNKLRTARQLGISRSTLYRILANETFLAR